jgi:hypothetical protein
MVQKTGGTSHVQFSVNRVSPVENQLDPSKNWVNASENRKTGGTAPSGFVFF